MIGILHNYKTTMSENLFRYRGLLGTALGTGIFIGAAGLFLILRIIEERKKKILNQHCERLDLIVTELHGELTALRSNSFLSSSRLSLKSNASRSSRLKRSTYETDDEMFSALGSDENEEFFDITSDDEEISMRFFKENEIGEEAEPILNLFDEVDRLFKGSDQDRLKALKTLHQEETVYCENSDFLWRMAKAHQMQALGNDDIMGKDHILQGLAYAEKALAIDPSNPDAHKWYAILVGMQGKFLSLKDKIQSGYAFQKHLLEALKSKPNDSSLYHLLGRFKYEIANLSWIEKKVASTLFSELPEVSIEEAIQDLLKAEDLNAIPWKENRLSLAKCYIAIRNYSEALHWLEAAKEIKPVTQNDQICDEECESLLSKYQKHGIK